MEAWGAGVLAVFLEGGMAGGAIALAVLLLRPPARWSSGLLLLGLLHLLVPPVVTLPLVRPTLIVEWGGGAGAGTATLLSVLALLQWAGLGVGLLVLGRSLLIVRRALGDASRVTGGPLHRALERAARERGVPTPRLHLTRDLGPAAVGVLRPAVLLPRGLARDLEPGALRMVLAHEVAHVARRDTLVAPLRLLAVSAWWFHPVAWLLARLQRQAAEDAADDEVTRRADPEGYCRALLAAAAGRGGAPGPVAVASGRRGHPLARRFRRLLGPGPGPRAGSGLLALLAVLLLITAPFGWLAFDTGSAGGEDEVLRHVGVRQETVVRRGVD